MKKLALAFLWLPFLYFSQEQRVIDSLSLKLKKATDKLEILKLKVSIGEAIPVFRTGYWDTLLMESRTLKTLEQEATILNDLAFMNGFNGENERAIELYNKSIKLNKGLGNKSEEANVYYNLGNLYVGTGELNKALVNFEKGMHLYEEIKDKKGIANGYNNLGGVYNEKGDLQKSLDYFTESLKLNEELGDKSLQATALNNIAGQYAELGYYQEALMYYEKSLRLCEQINNLPFKAALLNNIGHSWMNLKNTDKAIHYYERSIEIAERIHDLSTIATLVNNLSTIYFERGNIEKAIDHLKRSKSLSILSGDKQITSSSFVKLSQFHLELANTKGFEKEKNFNINQALILADSGIILAKEIGSPELISGAEKVISGIYASKGNYEQAYKHYLEYVSFQDSYNQLANKKAVIQNKIRNEYETKVAILKEKQEKELFISNERHKINTIIIAGVVAILVMVIVFSVFIYNSLKKTRFQKLIIEEKQKEILDSINYAQRIQRSLMPTEKFIEKKLKGGKKG